MEASTLGTPLNFIFSPAIPLNTSVESTMIGKEGPSTFLSVMLFSVKKKKLKGLEIGYSTSTVT